MAKAVRDDICTIPDFPHASILFRDVTTLFADARDFRLAIDQMLTPYAGLRIDKLAGLEARGFMLGGAVAHQLSTSFVSIRKTGKLAARTVAQSYLLEYGEVVVEMHDDALQPGEKVLLVDDLLATGGTAKAGFRLIERRGAEVIGCAFVVDLPDFGGQKKLKTPGMEVHALCAFAGLQPFSVSKKYPRRRPVTFAQDAAFDPKEDPWTALPRNDCKRWGGCTRQRSLIRPFG